MKIYVDCDGVILDSEIWLFDEEYKSLNIKTEEEKIIYIQKKSWDQILRKSQAISNAIEILKELKDVAILTKVHSMKNEGVAKIKLFRYLGLENQIILVPYTLKKTDVVCATGNILVDDTVHNLDDWFKNDDTKHIYIHAKDNIQFHSIIFPALLLANTNKYHLPDEIFAY